MLMDTGILKTSEMIAFGDDRNTHNTESLKKLGGIFYEVGREQWCDTIMDSWRKEGKDLWVKRG